MRRPPAARPLPLLPRWAPIGVALLVLAGGGVLAARWYAGRRAVRELISPAPGDTMTPRSLGVPYADLQLQSGDHAIHAWWVRAGTAPAAAADTGAATSAAPAVLLFHGNHTSLSQQVDIQQVLYRAGISSLAFDYAGFGVSGGTPSPNALRADARAAYAAFADSARDAGRRVLLGTSLGAAVLLDAITDLQTGIDGIVLVGAFTSAREIAVARGRVPSWLSWLLPDLYDNLTAIRRVTAPLLIVHSAADSVFSLQGAERLLAVAPVERKQLVHLDHTRHDEYLSSGDDWRPVIAFIKRGFQR
jgi:alpha-beta hydrolase superfamily lysophospholipase